jgi:hypothetical protein
MECGEHEGRWSRYTNKGCLTLENAKTFTHELDGIWTLFRTVESQTGVEISDQITKNAETYFYEYLSKKADDIAIATTATPDSVTCAPPDAPSTTASPTDSSDVEEASAGDWGSAGLVLGLIFLIRL